MNKINNPIIGAEITTIFFEGKEFSCKTNIRKLDSLKKWRYHLNKKCALERYEVKSIPPYECVYCKFYKKYTGSRYCNCFLKNEIRAIKELGTG